MTQVFKEAVAKKAAALPDTEQDKIGGELLAYVKKLEGLRREVEKGIESLDAGRGRELDIEDVIRRARDRHDKA